MSLEDINNRMVDVNGLAKLIILNCNSIEEILKKLKEDVIPYISLFSHIYEFGKFENYTFYSHGFINHERCSRRCIKECIIEY